MARIALCIGINDYPGTGSDLSGCVNDANDWAEALSARGFSVEKLLDGAATGRAMRDAIAATVDQAAAGETVVIQYSGHGSFIPDEDGDEPDGFDECLCPHDIATNGPITDDELFEIYSRAAVGARIIVISDSCHSGTVAKFAPITTPPTMRAANAPQRKVRFLPPAVFMSKTEAKAFGGRRGRRASTPPGRGGCLLLAGCQDTEYSYDAFFEGRPNGAFSFVAMRELAQLKPAATYAQWYSSIRKALPSSQYPQSPNLYGTARMRAWKVLR